MDGEWFCNSLEPSLERRNFPAIPFGSYKIALSMSAKFRDKRPYVLGVPGRVGIMVHEGNSVSDTLGCILLGINRVRGRVIDSKKHVLRLVHLIEAAESRSEDIRIVIV